jgi:hypothetical protein
MSLREFADDRGLQWAVWDVIPSMSYPQPRTTPTEHPASDGDGWLAFECLDTGERRRFVPAPRDWHLRTDAELVLLCGDALPLPRRRRLNE